ncbi:MAG TPA: ribulose-phosphate 3-epimerase [Acidobacteriota bacterium]|nr:ribulose-phosphate 3-epimerase [Acidobacteriota bacterium]
MALIAPSILSADFTRLGRDVESMREAGAKMLHFDVMDGHFVPEITIGLPVLRALRKATDLKIDVHLMISNPDSMAEAYAEAGADMVSVHYEAATHLDRLLEALRAKGAQAGVALNPHSPVSVLEDVLPKCDFVLVMSVNPGYAGQAFIPHSFEKIRKLRKIVEDRKLAAKIEIDGGMGPHNVSDAAQAGTDWIVSGSAIFGSDDPKETFRKMQQRAQAGAAAL